MMSNMGHGSRGKGAEAGRQTIRAVRKRWRDKENRGGWTSSDYGYITFTLKTDTSKKLEFTAVGFRVSSDGLLGNPGGEDHYWSSVAFASDRAYLMRFTSSSLTVHYGSKQYGWSVRCVRQ